MKIITTRQQGEAMMRLSQLNDALMSEDELKRLDAIENTAELAYIIGGLRLMNMVKVESFGEGDGFCHYGEDARGSKILGKEAECIIIDEANTYKQEKGEQDDK